MLSVSDKEGIVEFGKTLNKLGVKIISTGGTASALKRAGIEVRKIESLTEFPECLDGRVKTLHPAIHAAILADRKKKPHMKKLKELKIEPIDLVVVNLYQFKETVSKKKVKLKDAIENIDIGGPTMIRAAAKNYESVTVIVDPKQYGKVIAELKSGKGKLSLDSRKILAEEAFEYTACYDSVISNYLRQKFSGELFPENLSLSFEKLFEPRYGENPHQKAAFYKELITKEPSLVNAKILGGKELSFNNLLDASAAVELIREFSKPAAVIIKHNNPCGVALAGSIEDSFEHALACDPLSAFGGIITLNRECNFKTARKITSFFNEVVIAPKFNNLALKELKTKKNLRILLIPELQKKTENRVDFKRVNGGLLVQERDLKGLIEKGLKFVSKKKPSKEEIKSMLFAWKVAKHVRSNAIVLAKGTNTVGIGPGQMARIDSVELAIKKSMGKAKGSVLASDGFFPFRDSIDLAAKAGIKAVIEPGGSIKDKEVIEAADEHDISLVFTGVRHFRH